MMTMSSVAPKRQLSWPGYSLRSASIKYMLALEWPRSRSWLICVHGDVDSANNLTTSPGGKTLVEWASPSRWNQGPHFLHGPSDQWPSIPPMENREETRKTVFCGLTVGDQSLLNFVAAQFTSWKALVNATYQFLYGAATLDAGTPSPNYRSAEAFILSQSQAECFLLEFKTLKAGKPVPLLVIGTHWLISIMTNTICRLASGLRWAFLGGK